MTRHNLEDHIMKFLLVYFDLYDPSSDIKYSFKNKNSPVMQKAVRFFSYHIGVLFLYGSLLTRSSNYQLLDLRIENGIIVCRLDGLRKGPAYVKGLNLKIGNLLMVYRVGKIWSAIDGLDSSYKKRGW
ncbi:hypothetical protein ACOSQ2_015773 [Xanthoceras sorbifolium]